MPGQGMLSTSVDLNGMTAAQSTFTDAVSHCTKVESNMETQMSSLGAAWQGEAQTGYIGAMHTWLENFQAVNRALQNMLNALEGNTSAYSKTHASTLETVSSLRNSVGQPLGLKI